MLRSTDNAVVPASLAQLPAHRELARRATIGTHSACKRTARRQQRRLSASMHSEGVGGDCIRGGNRSQGDLDLWSLKFYS